MWKILARFKKFLIVGSSDRPGEKILTWGSSTFLLTFAFLGATHLWFPGFLNPRGLEMLFGTPLFIVAFPIICTPVVFIATFVGGIPWISISAAFASVRRVWRVIVGTIFLLSVVMALWFANLILLRLVSETVRKTLPLAQRRLARADCRHDKMVDNRCCRSRIRNGICSSC